MKKSMILTAAVCAVAMSVSAEWEKVGVAQIADASRLSAAVVKLAEFSGNQMLGLMLAGAVQNPYVEDFGPAREDEDVVIALFLDTEKAAKAEPKDVMDTFEYAIVYPIASTRDQFLAGHAGGVWTNGLYRVEKDEDDDEGLRDFIYFAFSADSRFVAMSDVAEQAKIAISEQKNLRPLKNNLARLVVDPKGQTFFRKSLSANPRIDKDEAAVLNSVDSFEISVGLYENGLEMSGSAAANPDGMLAEIGKVPLLENRLFHGVASNAVFAADYAKDASVSVGSVCELWADLKPVLMKHGIRADYMKVAKKGICEEISLDIAGVFKYIRGNENALGEVDGDQFAEDVKRVVAKYSTLTNNNSHARQTSLILTGYEPKFSPVQHFKRTMRGVDLSGMSFAGVVSIAGILNALMPVVEANLPDAESDRLQMSAIRKMLPAEGEGATAYAVSRKDNRFKVTFRLDADDIKPFGCLAGALIGAMMMTK